MKPIGPGTRALLFFVIVAFLAFGLVLVWKQLPFSNLNLNALSQPTVATAPVIAPTTTVPSVASTTIPTSTTTVVRARPSGAICDDTNSICVDASYQNILLTSPFVVTGTAIAFENQFAWRLEDASGTIASGSAYASSSDVGLPGPFSIREFILTVPRSTSGTLVFFERSPKDESEMHVSKIPARLPMRTRDVIFFAPNIDDAHTYGLVYPVKGRIVTTTLPLEATLRSLLFSWWSGTNGQELQSLKLKNGTLSLVFDAVTQDYEAHMSPGTFSTSIIQTAKQFSGVNQVLISFASSTQP